MGEMLKYAAKIALTVAAWLAFFTALQTFVNLMVTVTFGSVIHEVFDIISMCLPFDASIVFGAIGTAISAIFAFIVARRIYMMVLGQQMANS